MTMLGFFGDLWKIFTGYLSLFSPLEHLFMVLFFVSVFFLFRVLVIRERIKNQNRFK